ncbi:hypothetical protein [Wenyingzhuangia sp. 2_MG-2023]|uniref:hypothetical protein n=1 Tax=Wenyingzhuangia sp. 2_MG-2023 TaxID=3062639 RepID=UPI0026E2C7FA|nr:hypothetical protein [Wenyingzhuangia sp. 2_MG-2023]MDO6736806.1 hypothetical protein [Wenyingzhuangia sp. 2_MG-2023]
MKRLLLASLLTLFLFSCSDDDNFSKFHIEYLPIDEAIFPSTFDYNEEYDITFKYTMPNSCYYFDNLYYKTNDSIRTVAIVAYVDDESECTEETREEEQTFKITAAQKEDYIFKIWKGKDDDNEDVYDEIIVPVLEEDEQ